MQVLVNSENLHLSEKTRTQICDVLGKLEAMLPISAQVRLFLRHEGRSDIRAVLTVRDQHQSFAYSISGPKLLALVRSARVHLMKSMRDGHQKRTQARKRRLSVTPAA